MEPRNSRERVYLSAYVAEQEELRASAAALVEQGKPLREQHSRLLEEYQRLLPRQRGLVSGACIEV